MYNRRTEEREKERKREREREREYVCIRVQLIKVTDKNSYVALTRASWILRQGCVALLYNIIFSERKREREREREKNCKKNEYKNTILYI